MMEILEPVHTKCPICGHDVEKIIETDWEPTNHIECESEYYCHYVFDNKHKLVKYKNPKHNYFQCNPDISSDLQSEV